VVAVKMFRKDEGFTLVELMVVVLIIGILVAVAIPVLSFARDYARKNTCMANLRVLDGAVQQWVAADPANSADGLDTLAAAQAVLSDRVKDFASSARCPSDQGSYTVTDGTFSCPNAVALGHDYF
jgi:prepilin-type N-terminal cleavage/methylation domain-containing protein